METTITWFRHHHENRNDLLRFGFMRLHYSGKIRYVEQPFSNARSAGFSHRILSFPDPRHLSFILVENGQRKLKCLVDNEDSFALITPLISEVDVCFCAGFNSDFFEHQRFVNPYSWQDATDIGWYRQKIERKIHELGSHFHKIRKFIPIAPNQATVLPVAGWRQKFRNISHRINQIAGKGTNFADVYREFSVREAMMEQLRNHDLFYDIVLNDTLWGWPTHRINLHKKLQNLHHKKYRIHSILNWTAPSDCDGSSIKMVNPDDFPMKTSPINHSYEEMLAQSRLAVFACGFHWGWRNIMMLALRVGLPVVTDRLLTEPYFDMNEFTIFQQEGNDWEIIEPTLNRIGLSEWKNIKIHNQTVYDKYMSPEAVANYFLRSLEIQVCSDDYKQQIAIS